MSYPTSPRQHLAFWSTLKFCDTSVIQARPFSPRRSASGSSLSGSGAVILVRAAGLKPRPFAQRSISSAACFLTIKSGFRTDAPSRPRTRAPSKRRATQHSRNCAQAMLILSKTCSSACVRRFGGRLATSAFQSRCSIVVRTSLDGRRGRPLPCGSRLLKPRSGRVPSSL